MKLYVIGFTLFGVIALFSGNTNAWLNFNRVSRNLPYNTKMDDIVENQLYGIVETASDDEPCYARKCGYNGDCCPGSICVIVDGDMGTCLFLYGRKIGDLCHRNSDCETGLQCAKGASGSFVCQAILAPIAMYKQFGDDCNTSNDCDVNRGLCCQLLRRHHHRYPKKVCSFYRDPLMCIDVIEEEAPPAAEKKH